MASYVYLLEVDGWFSDDGQGNAGYLPDMHTVDVYASPGAIKKAFPSAEWDGNVGIIGEYGERHSKRLRIREVKVIE